MRSSVARVRPSYSWLLEIQTLAAGLAIAILVVGARRAFAAPCLSNLCMEGFAPSFLGIDQILIRSWCAHLARRGYQRLID
jgi:hypothetical protein